MQSENAVVQTDSGSRGAGRVYYLDWLRVLAILTVFVFHCGRFLTWKIGSSRTQPPTSEPMSGPISWQAGSCRSSS